MIKHFGRNTAGRDFAVGDIHGHFTRLQAALDAVGFDPAVDRLFSVGDLVDRGPESRDALDWLARPWFHAVRGNHDDYVCRFDTCDEENWIFNGGAWFSALPWDEKREFAAQFRELPIAIEVESECGLVGIVHADCPFESWNELQFELTGQPLGKKREKKVRDYCMWSRKRLEESWRHGVKDLCALVVGHNPVRQPTILSNVYHIDTMGWRPEKGGHFTLLNLNTLESIPPAPAKLQW